MPLAPKEKRRLDTCREAQAMISQGKTVAETSKLVGVARGTLERWLRMYRRDGLDGLRSNYSAVGRPAVADCLPPEFADFIRRKAAMCGSMALAYQFCIDDPTCPEELREFLAPKLVGEKPLSLPPSLRRIAKVTPELAAALRGPRALGHIGFKSRHSDLVIDPVTGQERKLLAGDIYLSDDMSTNHPFWFNLPDGERETRAGRGDKLAKKHGVAIGRQGLYTNDARGKWLGCDLIGRPTDAYTSADILRHFRRIIAEWGMPRIGWILEKGVWLARSISGKIKVVIDDGARGAVVAGLSSLGFEVTHVHTSEGKALIEGAFGHLQSVLDLLEIPTVGRVRGEMERVEKMIRRVQTGVIHPEEGGIPYIGAHIQNVQKAMVFCNGKPKFGRIQNGVPDEVWSRDTEAHPLRRLTPEQMGMFLPLKYATSIRQGCVDKMLGGILYRFTSPEFARLGVGYRLAVAFDPGDASAGAEIYNLETGSRNSSGYSPGQWICHAEHELELPLYGYTEAVRASTARRKAHRRAFAAAYAGTGLFGRGAGRALERRDASGRLERIEQFHGEAGAPKTDTATRHSGARAPLNQQPGLPSISRRKQMTESEIDAAAAEAAAMEERLRERGMLLPY